MTTIDTAIKILKLDEGFEEKPYYDTKRIPTYGHGFVCGKKNDPLPDISITPEESLKRLRELVAASERTMNGNPDLFAAYKNCNEAQKAVLLSMTHQLGVYGLLKFKKLLAALYRSDFNEASKQCLDSQAAKIDAPERFKRNAAMLKTGALDPYYK